MYRQLLGRDFHPVGRCTFTAHHTFSARKYRPSSRRESPVASGRFEARGDQPLPPRVDSPGMEWEIPARLKDRPVRLAQAGE